jgi:hypothetical protein
MIVVPNPTYDPNARFNNVVRVTVRNRGKETARNTEVYLYWADPATNLPFPSEWRSSGIYTDGPDFLRSGNKIVLPQLASNAATQVDFAWAPPAPGSNIRGDNHFCLLVRVENEKDPSRVNKGGVGVITADNNIALRNVDVQQSPAELGFYVLGTEDVDTLIVSPDFVNGRLELTVPVQALPWRDRRLIEQHGRRRSEYGGAPRGEDPLAAVSLTVRGETIRERTDIEGADTLRVHGGLATIVSSKNAAVRIPSLRVMNGARLPMSVRVRYPRFDDRRRYVRVAQLSGGRRVGGVTLVLTQEE